jgi:hypothetical protein
MPRPAGPLPEHGTRARYQLRGTPCRCDACREANADYVIQHRTGTTNRVSGWGEHKGYYPRGRREPQTMLCQQQQLPPEFLPQPKS